MCNTKYSCAERCLLVGSRQLTWLDLLFMLYAAKHEKIAVMGPNKSDKREARDVYERRYCVSSQISSILSFDNILEENQPLYYLKGDTIYETKGVLTIKVGLWLISTNMQETRSSRASE